MDQNAEEKTLILQASSPAISDTLSDSSHAQRLQNQSVYAEVVCRPSLYRSFLSLCYWRSYTREVLGELAAAHNIVVINDEAHHAWRIPAESKVRGVRKEEIEEATK